MKLLKAAVILMGILLVVGFAFLGKELFERISHKKEKKSNTHEAVTYTLDVSKHAKITNIYQQEKRILVLTEDHSTSQSTLFMIDAQNGRVISTYKTP